MGHKLIPSSSSKQGSEVAVAWGTLNHESSNEEKKTQFAAAQQIASFSDEQNHDLPLRDQPDSPDTPNRGTHTISTHYRLPWASVFDNHGQTVT